MFKPFDIDIQDIVISVESDGYAAPIDTAPSGLTFDIGQFYVPETIDSSVPIMTSGNLVKMIAEAAVSASIGNGHVFNSESDGCACCGHDQGLDHKTAINTLIENINSAIASGALESNVNGLIDFSASSMGVSFADVSNTLKEDMSAFGAEAPMTSSQGAVDTVAGDSSTTFSIDIGGSVSGTRNSSTDADWYSVDLVAGETYTFLMLRDGANPHEDPLLQLIGTNGASIVATNDDIDSDGDGQGDNRNSLISYTVPAGEGGTYYVSAEGWSTTTGDYTIYAELGNARPDFTLDQSAYFLTHQFDNYSAWGTTNLTYDVSGLPPGAQSLAILAMQAWAEVSGITFTAANGGNASITFQNTEDGAYASTSSTNGVITSSTVNIAADWSGGNLDLNSYTYQTYLHEVGHALGLGHGGPYNGNANYSFNRAYNQDAWNYTVMSYFDQAEAFNGTARLVLGLQIVDLIAIQSMYGTNAGGTRAGDSVYGFNVSADILNTVLDFENTFDDSGIRPPSLSIYDTDGVDTLDFSGWNTNQTISLVQETFSSIGDNTSTGTANDALINVINVARGTDIENAIGGGGNDTITGNDLDNIITGNGGNDIIEGGDGNDIVIFAGNQSAYTITDLGNNTFRIVGPDGTDTVSNVETARFSDGDVALAAPSGPTFTENADTQDGTEGDDVLNALGGDDVVNGLGGNDTINGDAGDDTLDGGAGNDTINGGEDQDTIYGGLGDDTIDGGARNDTLYGGDGADTIYGGTQNDMLFGDAGNDNLFGDKGNDVIEGGTGDDTLEGGTNNDILRGDGGNDTLRGGDDDDFLYGGTENDMLYGDAGTDELYGEDGTDSLFGGAGSDELYGGAGNDTLDGGSQNDILDGGLGADVMTGGSGNDIYYVDNAGDDVIELAGAGSGYDIVNTTLNTFLLSVGDNIERVNFQGTGNFVTRGNEGDNRFTGAAGNDRFILDSGGSDIFSGGQGRDAFDARSSTNGITIRLDDQSLHGGDAAGDTFASIESFFGSNTAGDYMVTGTARARFSGFGGDDTLIGGASVDFLQGGADNDTLDGGAARDTLQGGTGNDMMTGGSDRDQFLFVDENFGQDTILDWDEDLDYLKIFSAVATSMSDFTITGNGTATVVLTLNSDVSNTITLTTDDGSLITLDAGDFQFYGPPPAAKVVDDTTLVNEGDSQDFDGKAELGALVYEDDLQDFADLSQDSAQNELADDKGYDYGADGLVDMSTYDNFVNADSWDVV